MFASWTEIPQSGVKAICQLASSSGSDESIRLVDHLGVSPDGLPSAYSCPISLDMCHMEQLTHEDLKVSQEQDPVIGVVKQDIEVSRVLTLRKSSDPVLTVLQRQGPKLVIRNQLLYRVSKSSCGKEKVQLVLPAKYHPTVLKSLHDDSGHLGVDRTTELIRDRFYWPRMTLDIEQYIKTCGSVLPGKTITLRSLLP